MAGTRAGWSPLSPPSLGRARGPRSLGTAATRRAPGRGATGAHDSSSPPPRAWTKRHAPRRGRIPRWPGRRGGPAGGRRACEATSAAASSVLCRRPSQGKRGRGRPRAAGARPGVRRPARGRGRQRRGCGPGAGTPGASATPVAVAHAPLWQHGRDPPHPPRPSRTASADRPTPDRGGLSRGGCSRGAESARGSQGVDGTRPDGAPGGRHGYRDFPGLARPNPHRGTWFAGDHAPCGHRSRVAREARTAGGLGEAHGGGLAGLHSHPAAGPPVPAPA